MSLNRKSIPMFSSNYVVPGLIMKARKDVCLLLQMFFSKQIYSIIIVPGGTGIWVTLVLWNIPPILPEAFETQLKCKRSCFVHLSIHHWGNFFRILKNDSHLTVTFTEHAPVVDVSRTCKRKKENKIKEWRAKLASFTKNIFFECHDFSLPPGGIRETNNCNHN